MPVKCKKCNLYISTKKFEDYFHCKGKCGEYYHRTKTCLKDYIKSLNTGTCAECTTPEAKRSEPKGKLATGTFGEQRAGTAEKFIDLDPNNTTIEKLLLELNTKMAVVFEIKSNTEFYAAKYDELLQMHQEMNKTIKTNEKKIEDLYNKCKHLEVTNAALDMKIQRFEQEDKNQNLEVVGLENEENENTSTIVKAIAEKIEANPNDVERVWRVSKVKKSAKDRTQNQNLIIRFRTQSAKEEWYTKRRCIRKNSDIRRNGSNNPIYINEHLTNYNKELIWSAKQKLKPNFKFVWSKRGRIFCRENDSSKIIPLYHISDIENLLLKKNIAPDTFTTPTPSPT